MLRRKPSARPPEQRKLSEAECADLAAKVYGVIFDPISRRGWDSVLTANWFRRIGNELSEIDGIPVSFFKERLIYFKGDPNEAFKRTAPKRVIAFLKSKFFKDGLTEADAKRLEDTDCPLWADIQKAVEDYVFEVRAGRKAKARLEDYQNIAAAGESLFPTCLKLVEELERKTNNSATKILEYLEADYPAQSKYLQDHLSQLDAALKDNRLWIRGKKPHTRARLLADGLAGAALDLSFWTSVTFARQSRQTKSPAKS